MASKAERLPLPQLVQCHCQGRRDKAFVTSPRLIAFHRYRALHHRNVMLVKCVFFTASIYVRSFSLLHRLVTVLEQSPSMIDCTFLFHRQLFFYLYFTFLLLYIFLQLNIPRR